MSQDPPPPLPPLPELRERIREIDRELVELAAERMRIARDIGDRKRTEGLPTVDYTQERKVLEAARRRALRSGLDAGVAEDLIARLIRASVSAQEEDSLRHAEHGRGRAAVVLGGAGRMGRWMHRFLAAQGWDVSVLDPRATPAEIREAEERLFSADLLLLATPPGRTVELYRDWADEPPRGILIDLASIKTPLVKPIRALQGAGARVGSIHPMFGPATLILRDTEVALCDTGDAEALEMAKSLFAPTTARLVPIPLEEHDRIMADLLSLAHATAIAFALALPETEHPVHSTTFQALETLSAAVVRESPDVYYEIQAENPHSVDSLRRLSRSLEKVQSAVAARSRQEFAALLEEGRRRTPMPSDG